jgi:tetratricopeptide (TPR) repeat protein
MTMRSAACVVVLLAACSTAQGPSSSGGTATATATVSSSRTVGGAITEPVATAGPDASANGDATAGADAAETSSEAARLYREANEAAGRNEFTTAARLFGEAYERAPSLEMAFNAFRMCERSAAVTDAERWHARVMSHSPPAALRADLDQRMAALRDFARRRQEDIARPPPGDDQLVREAAQFFARGVQLYQRRRYQPALEAFEAALRFSQESRREVAELYFNLAVTHEHLGHRTEAAAAFREFLSRRPDTPDRSGLEDRIRTLSQ